MHKILFQREPLNFRRLSLVQSDALTRFTMSKFLSLEERKALKNTNFHVLQLRVGKHLVHGGEPACGIHFLATGWAYRYKLLPDGRRQILRLLLPGDICNLDVLLFGELDYGVVMLTPASILSIPRDHAQMLVTDHPGIAHTFTWLSFVENATLAHLAMGLGRQTARERIAHLLCELSARLGCADDGEFDFEFPLTQGHLADMLGMTPVHICRTLNDFRIEGLLVSSRRRMTITDLARLRRIAEFCPEYLHLDENHDGTSAKKEAGRELEYTP